MADDGRARTALSACHGGVCSTSMGTGNIVLNAAAGATVHLTVAAPSASAAPAAEGQRRPAPDPPVSAAPTKRGRPTLEQQRLQAAAAPGQQRLAFHGSRLGVRPGVAAPVRA